MIFFHAFFHLFSFDYFPTDKFTNVTLGWLGLVNMRDKKRSYFYTIYKVIRTRLINFEFAFTFRLSEKSPFFYVIVTYTPWRPDYLATHRLKLINNDRK